MDFANSSWPCETGVETARSRGLTGKGIRVVVLDTGIDADHNEFRQDPIRFFYVPHELSDAHLVDDVRGFDTQGHGSHVSGIIAGRNIGLAPEAELCVAAICESETQLSGLIRFEQGLKWVIDVCKDGSPSVLNLSVGFFPPPTPKFSEKQWESWISLLRQTLRVLERANVMVVAAWTPTYQVPAELFEVIAVGALDFQFSRLDTGHYTSRHPDLWGLGADVSSAAGRDREGKSLYKVLSGASQAAAYVTGIATLWRQAHPQLDVHQTREMLVKYAFPLHGGDDMLEAGLARYVDLADADRD